MSELLASGSSVTEHQILQVILVLKQHSNLRLLHNYNNILLGLLGHQDVFGQCDPGLLFFIVSRGFFPMNVLSFNLLEDSLM